MLRLDGLVHGADEKEPDADSRRRGERDKRRAGSTDHAWGLHPHHGEKQVEIEGPME